PACTYPLSLHDALPIFALRPPLHTRGAAVGGAIVDREHRVCVVGRKHGGERGVEGGCGIAKRKNHVELGVQRRCLWCGAVVAGTDRKSTRLNSSHVKIS